MARELGSGGPDRQAVQPETADTAKAERQAAWVEHFRSLPDKINAQRLEQAESEITEVAETKGISRQEATVEWLNKRGEQLERGHQAYNLETSTSDLAKGSAGLDGRQGVHPRAAPAPL